ncbi:27111_t:CDS:1, partial [Racocetra persica]
DNKRCDTTNFKKVLAMKKVNEYEIKPKSKGIKFERSLYL